MTIQVVHSNYYFGDDVVYIARPSPLGNPYHSKPSVYDPKNLYKTNSVEESIEKYKKYLLLKIKSNDRLVVNELKLIIAFYKETGKLSLACFCKGKNGEDNPCHGDFIKFIIENYIKKNIDN